MIQTVTSILPKAEKGCVPWNEGIQRARQGDAAAQELCCEAAAPLIETFCNIPFFEKLLGQDEIRSTLYLKLAEFIHRYPTIPADPEVPFLLKRIFRFTLRNRVKILGRQTRREQLSSGWEPSTEEEKETRLLTQISTDTAENPEEALLLQERDREIRNALQQLNRKEQSILHALFFLGKSAEETARELKCGTGAVWKTRRKALQRLEQLLKARLFHEGAFCY